MILTILTNPNECLRKKARVLSSEEIQSAETRELISNLMDTMKSRDAVGIAAPQVGKSLRIIVINVFDEPLVFINPCLSSKALFKSSGEEGCLSVPGEFGIVKRHKRVWLKAFLADGKRVKLKAEGLFSRVLQHEIDHLDGILFFDRATKMRKEAC